MLLITILAAALNFQDGEHYTKYTQIYVDLWAGEVTETTTRKSSCETMQMIIRNKRDKFIYCVNDEYLQKANTDPEMKALIMEDFDRVFRKKFGRNYF